MGFLKKLGLVEEVVDETVAYEEETTYEEAVDVELADVNTETLIEDIYTQNNLLDKSTSIFKVEELINSLPKEMPTATKKASVLAILGSFGLTVTGVSLDGEKRIEVLAGVLDKIFADGKHEISTKEAEIERYKEEIARLEKEITEQQAEMKFSDDAINAEITRISELGKFIGGNE